ncbi:MAG: hypothetical protein BZY82_11520 [SAR202 cluster bacterium Io17-Chloro-G3]|nr:MAG: hypothetical protein BZY82_11520 [SAR202 cluster bacterium Io17-Chloro-G3]
MNDKEIQALRETVALANRVVHHTGLTTYLGHASARIPGTDLVLIKQNGTIAVSMDTTTAKDILLADLDGTQLDGHDVGKLPAEWCLHAEIYKARPDVLGILHTHQRWATTFGIAGVKILPVLHPIHSSVVADDIPVYDESYAIVTEDQQARVVAENMGDSLVCHLRTHGMVFAAGSIEAATCAAIDIEAQAEMNFLASQIGKPNAIPKLFMREALERRQAGGVGNQWSYYAWLDENLQDGRARQVQV